MIPDSQVQVTLLDGEEAPNGQGAHLDREPALVILALLYRNLSAIPRFAISRCQALHALHRTFGKPLRRVRGMAWKDGGRGWPSSNEDAPLGFQTQAR